MTEFERRVKEAHKRAYSMVAPAWTISQSDLTVNAGDNYV